MTIEEKRRELFDQFWLRTRHNIPTRAGEHYSNPVASCCWDAFNFALDAVVIDLPPEDTNGRITWTSAMRAIESAGLKVKQ